MYLDKPLYDPKNREMLPKKKKKKKIQEMPHQINVK